MAHTLKENEGLLDELIHSSGDYLLGEPQLLPRLSAAINNMILHHFDELIQILYRMDVSEARLKALLQQHAAADASDIIASLIIERQQQKIKTRELFKTAEDIPEEERW